MDVWILSFQPLIAENKRVIYNRYLHKICEAVVGIGAYTLNLKRKVEGNKTLSIASLF